MSKMERGNYHYTRWFATRRGRVLNTEDLIESFAPENCQRCNEHLDASNTYKYQTLDYCDVCWATIRATPYIDEANNP